MWDRCFINGTRMHVDEINLNCSFNLIEAVEAVTSEKDNEPRYFCLYRAIYLSDINVFAVHVLLHV